MHMAVQQQIRLRSGLSNGNQKLSARAFCSPVLNSQIARRCRRKRFSTAVHCKGADTNSDSTGTVISFGEALFGEKAPILCSDTYVIHNESLNNLFSNHMGNDALTLRSPCKLDISAEVPTLIICTQTALLMRRVSQRKKLSHGTHRCNQTTPSHSQGGHRACQLPHEEANV